MGTMLDTGTEQLSVELNGGVAVITMNRPERKNALTREMLEHSRAHCPMLKPTLKSEWLF